MNGNLKVMDERKTSFIYRRCISGLYCFIPLFLVGCTSLKKAALIGGGAMVPGAIASLASSGTAPVLLASTVGASVTSVVADTMTPAKGEVMHTAASCAPDNFWTLLGNIISMGGWLLILVIVIPMILGWLLPGPLEKAKKKRK
tara:strand:- start:174 stop:605 length:432 start_codon:yes stop_codon:yes gene_type:complete